jgi:esterase/lipase superfamily enzyme
LGNQLAIDMMLALRESQLGAPGPSSLQTPTPAPYRVEHYIALEPDVDTETFAESIAALTPTFLQDVTLYGNPDDQALGYSWRFHAHCRAGLIACEPVYFNQFSGTPAPDWVNVIDARTLAFACDPDFGHSYYTSPFMLVDMLNLVLDRTRLMTPTSPRSGMHYSEIMGKNQPNPHYWIDDKNCTPPSSPPPR